VVLSERTTRAALRLAETSQSGRRIDLGRSLRLERSFDRLWLYVDGAVGQIAGGSAAPVAPVAAVRPMAIDSWGPGEAVLSWPGARYRVRWAPTSAWTAAFAADVEISPPAPTRRGGRLRRGSSRWSVRCVAEELEAPLRLRPWRAGDRIRLAEGSRKLKRLFGDRRVPVHRRRYLPLLVDVEDRVLWVPGVARSSSIDGVGETWTLDIEERDD
jgi:tRNA(Ile)-lysidine synthetase-like protein